MASDDVAEGVEVNLSSSDDGGDEPAGDDDGGDEPADDGGDEPDGGGDYTGALPAPVVSEDGGEDSEGHLKSTIVMHTPQLSPSPAPLCAISYPVPGLSSTSQARGRDAHS